MSDKERDRLLGFNIDFIEHTLCEKARAARPDGNHYTWGHYLHQGNQTWVGLDPQTLQTPYQEIEELLHLLKPKNKSHLIDLGAGYGRLAFVLRELYPEVIFTGFEYVPERVFEGKRVFSLHGLDSEGLRVQDLTCPDFVLPVADYYFLYDYGNVRDIRHTLKQIEKVADEKNIVLIARGKGSQSLIEHEFLWLAKMNQAKNYSLYTNCLSLIS